MNKNQQANSNHATREPASESSIHWPSARAFLSALLVMDFRNQAYGQVSRTGPRDIFSPLFWVTGQNLLISFFVAGILFARVESYAFCLICFGLSMLVCVTSIIVEFNEVVLSPSDIHVIGHQPINYRTYAAARIMNLLVYISYVALTMTVIPTIFAVGLQETQWTILLTYPLASVVGIFFAAGCVILFYSTVFGGRPSPRAQETLAWTQAVLMLITGYGAQAVMRDSRDQLEMAIYRMPEWLQWTPPGILASFAVSGNWGWVDISWWIILVSGTATVGVWGLVFRSLSRSYEQLHHGLTRADNEYLPELKTPGDLFSGRKGIGYWWSSLLNRRMTRSVDERIGFWITRTMLSRDHDFRMRIWPTFGITIAFFGIGLYTGELVDPLVERGRNAALTISAIYSLSLPLPAIFHALQFSKHHESAWILSVAPIRDPALFARGVDKAILLLIMFPFLCLVLIVLATTWSSMASVVLHTLAASLLVAQSTYLTSAIAFRVIPFSRPLGRGEMLGSIAPLLATTGTYAMTMGGIHYLATSNYIWFSGYLGLMVGVTILLRIYAQQQIRRKCNLEVFHAEN